MNNRLQKKCFAGSALLHGLLLLAVFVGSAFISPRPQVEISPFELFIPPDAILVDGNTGGGGNPNAAAPPPQPPAPQPRRPEPMPAPVAEQKLEAQAVPEQRPSKAKIEPNLTPQKRLPSETAPQSQDKKRDDRRRKEEARKLLADLRQTFSNTGRAISQNTSGGTEIGILGPGGEAFGNYAQYVKQTYEDAWRTPSEALGDLSDVEVEVTIARDGKVLESRITKRSRNASLDHSVQEALNRVREVRRFPEGAKEDQRKFRITYNLISKQKI